MDAIYRFEQEAKAFEKATGHMMPGKDIPSASWAGQDAEDERERDYKIWCAGKRHANEVGQSQYRKGVEDSAAIADTHAKAHRASGETYVSAMYDSTAQAIRQLVTSDG